MLKQKIALTGKILTHSFQVRFVEFRNATVEHYKDSFDIFNTDSCLCHVFLSLPLSLFLFCLLTHSLKSTFTPGLLIKTKTMQPLTFFSPHRNVGENGCLRGASQPCTIIFGPNDQHRPRRLPFFSAQVQNAYLTRAGLITSEESGMVLAHTVGGGIL